MKNELKESKISLLDKIKWRIKYRELSSVLGSDTPLMRGIIKNKTIEEEYQEHKSDIIDYLKRIKEKMPDKMEDAENIMVQTIYDDYMRSAFQSNRTEESMIKPINAYEIDESVANFSKLLNNLDYMLWIGDKDKNQDENRTKFKEALFDKLSLQECRNKYMQVKMNALLEYDKRILTKYPLETLEKLSFIPGNRLNILTDEQIGCILKAIDENIEHSKIFSYMNIRERIQYETTIKPLVMKNMEFSDFFDKYYEKYNGMPDDDELENLFKYTRSNSARKIMLDLPMGDEYYSKLRDSYFDFKIENEARSGIKESSMNDYITKKYFNIKYSDIERIIKDKKQGLFSDETQKILKYITKINAIGDITDLIRINKEIGKRNIGIDLGAVYDELYNYYAKEKVEDCFNPKDFNGKKKTILFEGKEVQILMLQGEDFKGIIHAKGTRKNNDGFVVHIKSIESEKEAENEEPSDFMRKKVGSDTMSVSVEKDDSMGFFGGCFRYSLLLGFSNVKPENVLRYGTGDDANPVGKRRI